EVNPRYADAHTFLASLFLKTEDYEQAKRQARQALDVNPAHLRARSVLAAAEFLQGNLGAYERIRAEVHALNPTYPDLYLIVAEAAVAQRQYQTAVDFAGKAVELDPSSWWAYGVMGMNQLRTGAVDEGRRNLETAWAGDQYNPWYMNTLDLLDTFENFEEIKTPHFEIFVHDREAELLGPAAARVAEEAFVALRARYKAVPPTPIRLEIYPNHSDFSVRTLGLTGLGALGVSFGSTLVMDSPSALDPGSFNWASTIWHETAHAFHLAMSDHRVPRWFTEGLAVHEQHLARDRWGHKASPGWLQAYQDGRLHPVSLLNQGFIRPEYPEQVVHSYYQASLVFKLIEEEWGPEAILAMLQSFKNGYTSSQAVQEVLGLSSRAFDNRFDEFVQDRWGEQMRAVTLPEAREGVRILHREGTGVEALRLWVREDPSNFLARLSLGKALVAEGRYDEAEPELLAALGLFPEYGGGDGPLRYLAQVHNQQGDLRRAADALTRMGSLSETLPLVHVEAAALWMELGEKGAAAEALEKVVEIDPFDLDAHEELAGLYEEMEEWEGAVRERRALLALDPPNRADAHYRLAVALAEVGNRSEARTQVLRALEMAPTFEAALELLLELRRDGSMESGGMPMTEEWMGRGR
ncbi:MAG: tetratricopeptide repeat protein, partial [Gemmatimonadetes bacterium]|nr:tetratricopeptide repeat protein [Gemmatimonadota bacterium]